MFNLLQFKIGHVDDARDLGLNSPLMDRVLKDYKMHPYHVFLYQEVLKRKSRVIFGKI